VPYGLGDAEVAAMPGFRSVRNPVKATMALSSGFEDSCGDNPQTSGAALTIVNSANLYCILTLIGPASSQIRYALMSAARRIWIPDTSEA
jgi:hypothetical protein